MSRILVTGATGFVGHRLVRALVDDGHEVRAMTRHPKDYDGSGTPVFGDMDDPQSLAKAIDGMEICYYLVHSLDDDDFERKDAEAARAFAESTAASGVDQIVYLGGLGEEDKGKLSAHLRSRREVEEILRGGSVPVTVLRAAIIVGKGGISWEMTRQLVDHLPAMVVPKWAKTRTQPIGIDDAVAYLVGVAGNADALGQVFEIGGADVLTYVDMLQQAALVIHGKELPILDVPVFTPGLSSRWLSLVTDVDTTTGRNLIDSMNVEVIVEDHAIEKVVPIEPVGYQEQVRRAIEDQRQD